MSLGIAYVADETPRTGSEPVFGYRLIRRLGSGGHGEVWQAEGPGGFLVALKFIRQDDGPSEADVRSLEILRDIRHPNLLLTFGAWQIPGYLVLGMELADGTLWDRFCAALDAGMCGIPRDELLESLAETAKGVDYLNGQGLTAGGLARPGIQHRDLKPQNILLAGGGVKVADFGLARQIDHSLASHTGDHWTFAYAAPEFFRKQTASQSDQYSLAITYCHLRGGRTPFQGPAAVMMAGHLLFPPDLSMIPVEERPVVARALSKEPKERWPTCRSFVEALRAAVPYSEIGCPLQAVPDTDLGWLAPVPPQPPEELATRTKPRTAPPTETWNGGNPAEEIAPATAPAPTPAPAPEPAVAPEPDFTPPEIPAIAIPAAPRRRSRRLVKLASAASLLAMAGLGLGTPGLLAPTEPPPAVLPFPMIPEIAAADHPRAEVQATQLVVTAPETPEVQAPQLVLTPPETPRTPAPAVEEAPEPPLLAVTKLVGLAQPPAPALKAKALALKAPGLLRIVAGSPAHLAFEVTREGFSGPVSARIEGLPHGVVAEPMTLGRDEEVAVFRVTVPPDAASTEFPARLVAVADEVRAEAPIRIAIEPSRASNLLRKARRLFDGGKHAEALDALDEAMALNPDDSSGYLLRGMIAIKSADYERAVADFGEALKRRPRDATAYNNRGLARRALGDYHRAIADYDEAIRLKARDAVFHYNRGMAYHLLGDDVGAGVDFSRAIELDPGHAPSYRARSEALAKRGEAAQAKSDLDTARKLEGKAPRPAPGPAEPPAASRSRRASASTAPARTVWTSRPG